MPIFVKTETIKREFIRNKDVKKKYIKKHILWLKELKKSGVNIKSGFLVNEIKRPGAGGLLVIEAKNYKDALEIIKNDPMIKNQIVEWEMNEWIDISPTL